MAGKTLPGIGEDESGEHEASDSSDVVRAGDKSNPSLGGDKVSSADKTPSARATDRMPMGLPSRTIIGGPGIVDDDKVAEGLKRLRSLDEPLGPIPNSTPTLKEGIPVVPGLPVPVVTPGMAAADQARTRGTAHGHALSTPAVGQGLVPMNVDDRLKGTLLGHSLHLPDLPSAPEEPRAPEVRAIATVIAPRQTPSGTHQVDRQDFSHGDARFFESEPINSEMVPEHPRSTKVVRGAAIFAAVISIFVVAAFAWSHSHKSDSAQSAPAENTPAAPAAEATPAATPTAADNAAPGAGSTGTPAAATAAGGAPAAAVAPTAPSPTAEEAAKTAAAAEEVARAETPSAELKREVEAARAHKTTTPTPPPPRPRVARPAEASHSSAAPRPVVAAPKPAATPGKRKLEEDPDGTLPLTE